MIRQLAYLPLFLLFSCSQYGQLTFEAELPKKIKEGSGILSLDGTNFWLIEDNGNPDHLYKINAKGDLLKELEMDNGDNDDWEALAYDIQGNIYIGDFGNNANKRENLKIYKLPSPDLEKGDKINAETIFFTYPDQEEFPPSRANRRFDAEALFAFEGYLYIITKNRSNPFPGTAHVYRVPNEPGSYTAELVTTLRTCEDYRSCQITGAAINPEGTTVVLLSYGNLWIFDEFDKKGFESTPRFIALGASTQLEAVCFGAEGKLFLADEKQRGTGQNLYSFILPSR